MVYCMIDIVFPNKNEKEFIEIAKKLGYAGLIFVYPANVTPPKISSGKVKIKIAEKNKIVKSSDRNRQILEKGSADIIFDCELLMPKDYSHQRASGLNHVMCTLAAKNKVAIGFSFSTILEASPKQRAVLMGRMQQNIKLCRKYKTKMVIASFAKDPYQMRNAHDISSFFTVLGMHPSEAKTKE